MISSGRVEPAPTQRLAAHETPHRLRAATPGTVLDDRLRSVLRAARQEAARRPALERAQPAPVEGEQEQEESLHRNPPWAPPRGPGNPPWAPPRGPGNPPWAPTRGPGNPPWAPPRGPGNP